MADVEIECVINHETDKAFLIDDGKQEVWIAKSAITDQTGEGYGITSIFLPEWIATMKGLT